MPSIFCLKDGPVCDNTFRFKLGIQVSFLELREAFGNQTISFTGKNKPQFNMDKPSLYPERVVIEVKEEDGADSRFPQSGFYLFLELSPKQAEQLLNDYRSKR